MANQIKIKNKRASFEYFLVEKLVAGIQLTGTEIKSIRMGRVSLADAMGTHYNHVTKRVRKLLLTRRELKKLENKTREKGFTIVPTMLFINERGLAKLEIALARGKHFYDKRDSLKKKDIQREIDRDAKF